MKKVKAYFDGSSKDNPGTIGSYGYHINTPYFIEGKGLIKGYVTNNIAEYNALKYLLLELKELQVSEAIIYGDSKMVVSIVNKKWGNKKGKWKPHRKYPDLRNLAIECRELLEGGNYTLKHLPREKNATADSIADSAYGDINCSVVYNKKSYERGLNPFVEFMDAEFGLTVNHDVAKQIINEAKKYITKNSIDL